MKHEQGRKYVAYGTFIIATLVLFFSFGDGTTITGNFIQIGMEQPSIFAATFVVLASTLTLVYVLRRDHM